MTDDRRAHERITELEVTVSAHLKEHTSFEVSLAENTRVTKQIAENTAELVALVKGAKNARSFLLWLAPPIGIIAAFIAWLKVH